MSSGNRRTRLTEEFKKHAIALADDSGMPDGQVEVELGGSRGAHALQRPTAKLESGLSVMIGLVAEADTVEVLEYRLQDLILTD